MKIFVDTADIDEINDAMALGLVDGVTTNPSLIKKAKEKHGIPDMRKYIKEILKACGDRPVSLEVTGTSYEAMKSEAFKLVKMFKKYKGLVIKVPINPSEYDNNENAFDGLKLIRDLASQGVKVNTTLVMNPEQALLAAKAGAAYVSPFAGRVDDLIRTRQLGMTSGKEFEKNSYFPASGYESKEGLVDDNGVVSGVDLVAQIVEIFKNYSMKCEVLAASTRNARQAREFALSGAHVATIPFPVLKEMTAHVKTFEGIRAFKDDTVQEYADLLVDKHKFSINVKSE